MLEYELEEYTDFSILYNKLMSKDTNSTEAAKETTTTDSTRREDIITQLMMDNFNLELNKDSRFEKGRKIFFYKISYYNEKEPKTIIKTTKVLKIKKNQDLDFEVNGVKYKINLNKKNSSAKKMVKECDKKKTEKDISLHTFKTNSSDYNVNKIQNEKEDDLNIKKLKDTIENKIYVLEIIHNSHEVDGNLVVKEDINIQDGLKESLYYPKLEGEDAETEVESLKNDEELKKGVTDKQEDENEKIKILKEDESKKKEEENKVSKKEGEFTIKEDKSKESENKIQKGGEKDSLKMLEAKEIEEPTIIKKNSKILIEIKQNTSLLTLFNQMKNTIEDLKIFLPNDKFYYFGFVNENNAKIGLNEKDFIKSIKSYEILNPNYKIFLIVIKNNILFDLVLNDKADYATFYRNEIKKEVTEIKKEVTEIKSKIAVLEDNMNKNFQKLFETISKMRNGEQKPENNKEPK